MATERLLVLASSRKLGARCIAGLSLDRRRLARPVSSHGGGELSAYDTKLSAPPRELDVVQFGHSGHDGDAAQPENVVVDGAAWTNEGAMDSAEALALIESHLHTDEVLLGNRGKAVPAHVAAEGMEESLCLVEPVHIDFVLTAEHKARVRFAHGGRTWDLPLSDFTVANEVRRKGAPGNYSLADLGFGAPRRTILLLSLGSVNNEWHSKLAAGVLMFA